MEEINSKQLEDTNKVMLEVGPKRKRCFVITPIGEDNSAIRRHIDGVINAAIKPAIQKEYDVVVAHEITSPGSINKQVIIEIYNADLVIANLTDLNPNVMYELAIRHALKKPVIMIMEKNSNAKLPFDIVAERTIFYINDFQGVLDLKNNIIEAEKSLINDSVISNPIFDALNSYAVDESLIKNIEGKDKSEADVLKVILNKINRLEGSIANKDFEALATKDSRIQNLNIFLDYPEEITSSERNEISRDIMINVAKELDINYGYSIDYGVNDINTINLKLINHNNKLNNLNEVKAQIYHAIEFTLKDFKKENLKFHFEFY